MAKEKTVTATPEQIADFDALLDSLSPAEQAAVLKVWRRAQTFGYRTASHRVYAKLPAFLLAEGATEEEPISIAA